MRRKAGGELDLQPWARELCDAYFAEYPDHIEHYGEAGDAWCVHDSLYIFAWAISDHDWEDTDLDAELTWLARILTAREFPLDRFVRHIDLAAAVADNRGEPGLAVALRSAARHVEAA